MKKFVLIVPILFIFFAAFFLLSIPKSKTFNVVLGTNGYQPNNITIKKGDSVRFTTTLNTPFWPASNPHPTHVLYSGFDPKKGINPGDSWTYKFEKPGNWFYHDHIDPNKVGEVDVKETNFVLSIEEYVIDFYRLKIQKHDLAFVKAVVSKCNTPEWKDHGRFDECWTEFFSGITKDFGAAESMRILKMGMDNGLIAEFDCHNFSDQIGLDGYWQFRGGRKFEITKDFGICSNGFLHGFMLEHVSHGQDFEGSKIFCENIGKIDVEMGRQCRVGMGSGLVYFYWAKYNDDLKHIVEDSVKDCGNLFADPGECVYGVFGGVEHLFLGVHGSELSVDKNNPYTICNRQTTSEYKGYCYERVSRPLFSDLKYDVSQLEKLINQIPGITFRKSVIFYFGSQIGIFEMYQPSTNIVKSVETCRQFKALSDSCVQGVFNRLFTDTGLGEKFTDTMCSINGLTQMEQSICKTEFVNAKM